MSLVTTAHGTLPAFPLLGAVPSGHGANAAVWTLAAATPVVAGALVALAVRRSGSLLARLRDSAAAAVLAGVAWTVLAWQGGGAVGSGRLNAVGASPWRTGTAVAAVLLVTACLATGVLAAARIWRRRRHTEEPVPVVRLVPAADEADPGGEVAADAADENELAG